MKWFIRVVQRFPNKSIIFILPFTILSTTMLPGQEKVSVLNDQLTFYVPEGTIIEPPLPNLTSIGERQIYQTEREKKYQDKVTVFPWELENKNNLIEDESNIGYRLLTPEMKELVKNRRLTQHDFLSLFKTMRTQAVHFSDILEGTITASNDIAMTKMVIRRKINHTLLLIIIITTDLSPSIY